MRNQRLNITALLLCLAVLAVGAIAQEVPYLAGRVNDNAHVLSPSTASSLERMLKVYEDSTSNQIAILTIPSLDGGSLEEFSIRVVDTWKLGKKGRDNGALLLVVVNDRKVRIEVGRGLEGVLTDAMCSQIIRHEIIPNFKKQDYSSGVVAGVKGMIATIGGEYKADKQAKKSRGTGSFATAILVIIFGGIAFFVRLFSRPRWFRSSGWWGGGGLGGGGWSSGGWSSGGGGFGGFSGGGGSFGGGGSSGSW